MDVESLAKQKKCVDLALEACLKRQSPRTGFVHYSGLYEEHTDVIPLYENFCFVAALYRQKTVEAALEGKDLLERLLAFQTAEGNFPLYLHDFPKCKDRMQGLRIAPILIQLQRYFSSVLPFSLKESLTLAIEKILAFSKDKAFGPWQFRYNMCAIGAPFIEPDPLQFSGADWAEWLISSQLSVDPLICNFPNPFHSELQIFLNENSPQIQERFEPRVQLMEWILAEKSGKGFSKRLLQDHPLQMHLAAIWKAPIFLDRNDEVEYAALYMPQSESSSSADLLRLFWSSEKLNSFVAPNPGYAQICEINKNQWEILYDLPEEADQSHNDLFEALFYCNAAPDVEVTINDQKGMVFGLQDQIRIKTADLEISFFAELLFGSGDFCGHLSQANRPFQADGKNYRTYDWQVGIRTLRRTKDATLRVVIKLTD